MPRVGVVSGFFIDGSFGRGSGPGADDMDESVFLIMNHKQETECGRKSEIDPALVSRFGVRHIEPVFRVQVEEGRDGFVEGDAVLLEVGGGFGGVKLEAWHGISLGAEARVGM